MRARASSGTSPRLSASAMAVWVGSAMRPVSVKYSLRKAVLISSASLEYSA